MGSLGPVDLPGLFLFPRTNYNSPHLPEERAGQNLSLPGHCPRAVPPAHIHLPCFPALPVAVSPHGRNHYFVFCGSILIHLPHLPPWVLHMVPHIQNVPNKHPLMWGQLWGLDQA